MNIIEAEDLVKGLPDQVLFKEAQYPSGRIPQFLAVSEVQRRQDMRQRFQTAQQGQQPTVKDQILQGGIGSTGMAPAISSPPPMAPPAAPPAPMYGGGITKMAAGGMTPVYMQDGRTVPNDPTQALRRLQGMRREAIARGDARTAAAIEAQIASLSVAGSNATMGQMLPNPAQAAPPAAPAPVAAPNMQDLQTRLKKLRERNARPEQIANLERQIAGVTAPAATPPVVPGAVAPGAAANAGIPAAGAALTDRGPPPADRQAAPSGGIGAPAFLAEFFKQPTRAPEVQAAIDLSRRMAEEGLPPPVDLTPYIQSAQQRQQEARDEARQSAISSTLMNLGTGLLAGDAAAGLQRATQAATETLREGRREAQAEGRMAEQLQLQVAQQQRQNLLDTMKFRSEAVNSIANLVAGEEKANRNDRLQAAGIVATYNAALDRNRSELAVQGRLDARSERAARTAALDSATKVLLANPAIATKTPEQIAQDIRSLAESLDPDAFGSGAKGSSRFTVTEVPRNPGG